MLAPCTGSIEAASHRTCKDLQRPSVSSSQFQPDVNPKQDSAMDPSELRSASQDLVILVVLHGRGQKLG